MLTKHLAERLVDGIIYAGGDGPSLLRKLRSHESTLRSHPIYTGSNTLDQRTQEIKGTHPKSYFAASNLTIEEEARLQASRKLKQEEAEERARRGTCLPQ